MKGVYIDMRDKISKRKVNHKKYGGLSFTKDAMFDKPKVKGQWRKKRSRHQRAITKQETNKEIKDNE